jgi:hypothetical protein
MAFFHNNEELDAERLCDAAEAALHAVVEAAQVNGGRWVYPLDLMETPAHPPVLNAFTHSEIASASEFLVRMGVIEPRRSRAA